MSFLDSYKRLEKLCGEVLNNDRKISAYIDEMLNTPNGSSFVTNWNDDLKALKHYRWIRNQIAHDPGCDEKNMCNEADEIWLNTFYTRILTQTDPLALYRKSFAKKQKIFEQTTQTTPSLKSSEHHSNSRKKFVVSPFSIITMIIIFVLLVLLLSKIT